MNIGELTATLGIDTKGFDRGIGKASKSLFTLKNTIAALGIGALAYKLNSMSKEWERAYKVQEQAEAGLKQAMISMGRYTDAAYRGHLDLAKALQKTTTFGDEAVISGLKMLQTYRDIGEDVMPRAARAMTDLSALTGRDMVASANLLGKASMGLTGELRRIGITVDEVVYKEQGFLGILRQIESQVQGQAAALAHTKSGGMEQYLNIVGDLKERLGSLTLDMKMQFAPVLRDIVTDMSNWVDKQKELQDLGVPNFFDDAARAAQSLANVLNTVVKGIKTIRDMITWYERIFPGGVPGGFLDTLRGRSWRERLPRTRIDIYGPPKAEPGYEGFTGTDYWNYMAQKAEKNLKSISEVGNRTFRQDLVEAVQDWSGSFTDMLNEMAWGADVTFKDIARSFGMMVTRMMIQRQLVTPMVDWLSGIIAGGGPTMGVLGPTTFGPTGFVPGVSWWQKGGVFENNRVLSYARGGIVDRPRIFPMQGGAGLMGEAGPEAVMPLKRMPGGDLGIQAQGGGHVTYEIHNYINAVDAPSLVELMRRTPEAILGPLAEARQMGARI